ncbi:rhomboid family intramembrane serine protease [Phocicoccus pinnipedialis]|uniref:Rhomboid protease GluP n=1 Tax=Phocicoccus pinnipedialis TaxID=110845 RepID=A0A6V7RDV7_9BACL|nr:rhomboid family intramembrane serine protease [Jeotgalicoccus pinnipedialis]MBP1939297.1 rhomboid protease GluP [Jeotgalicoccus pinnipedialis]CAD2075984.1 Rhomboid protease GluP [Jeotgalicoccus pinnipedialis]
MANKWQAAYEIIRYTKYITAYYERETDTIWLKNKLTRTLMCINEKPIEDINVEGVTETIYLNKSSFDKIAGFEVKRVNIYYLNSKKNKRNFKSKKLRVTHYGIDNIGEIILSPFYKIDTKYKNPKQNDWYQRRVLSVNSLEMYMIKSTPMTSVLIMINTLIFLMNLFYIHIRGSNHFTNQLGLTHFDVVQGEYYRLISSAFLHANVEHFLFNIFALYILGKFVESIYSHVHMIVAYIITAVLANVMSLTFITDSLSLGASGAIYGLLGVLVVYMLINKKINTKLIIQISLIFIIISIVSSFFNNVNHYAHVGGIIYGLMLGVLFQFKRIEWRITLPVLVLMLVTPIILWSIVLKHDSYQPVDEVGLRYLNEKQYEKALEIVNETFEYNKETSTTYYILAKLYDVSGDFEKAKENYNKSYELDSKNELALKYKLYELRKANNYEGMKELIEKIDRKNIYDEELRAIEEDMRSKGY